MSGTTFERDGFKDMIAEVEVGNVETVIVKDMSRFGRNYLKMGFYTEMLFPEKDVRFIAINNRVNSLTQSENDFTPFLNIMNEWYAKDTSKKIRTMFRAKRIYQMVIKEHEKAEIARILSSEKVLIPYQKVSGVQ